MRRTLAVWVACANLLFACNDSSFKSSEKAQGASLGGVRSFSFQQSVKTPLDMVWVIDNSGSMRNEIANVRANFSNFIARVQNDADLKLALLSGTDTSLGVSLNQFGFNSSNMIQVSEGIDSNNALAALAMNTCTGGGGFFSSNKICGSNISASSVGYGTSGNLSQFYRQGSKKVFVFVTDDDAEDVTSANFWSLMQTNPLVRQNEASIFGFIAKAESNCSTSQIGSSYLALGTEAQMFDICLQDWSGYFNTLNGKIQDIVQAQFTIDDQRNFTVTQVLIDNQPLTTAEYTVVGKVITLNNTARFPNRQSLVVHYTYL